MQVLILKYQRPGSLNLGHSTDIKPDLDSASSYLLSERLKVNVHRLFLAVVHFPEI